MKEDGGERDYLVGTQLETNPDSFVQAVKEAFLFEHDCLHNQEIAEVLGVDKSRITQLFAKPKSLKAESIQNLLNHLKKKEHRKRIVRAWTKECFGEDIFVQKVGKLTGDAISENTVRRIDKMVRQSRLKLAALTAQEAYLKTNDVELAERLLDRAYWARQRLDEPGHAMLIVRAMAKRANDRADTDRLIAAHHCRIRILAGLVDCKPEELAPLFKAASDLLEQTKGNPPRKAPYILGNARTHRSLLMNSQILFMERKVIEIDADFLRQSLEVVLKDTKPSVRQSWRFGAWQTASRIYLLLGEFFQAQEALENSFNSGGLKNLQVYETSGLIQGRIIGETATAQEAAKYLRNVSLQCRKTTDLYHLRLVEYDLARFENQLF
jgi:predicted XRE-type DNA-binding protein